MKKTLLDIVFMSEKRKNVLLMLRDGTKEMETILDSLETTRQALLPQMKILKEHYLISNSEDAYELTTIGKLIVDEMIPLLGTIDVFDSDLDYWGNRNLDSIPLHLLEKIGKLGKCRVINPHISEIYSPPQDLYDFTLETDEKKQEFDDASNRSNSYAAFTTFFYPTVDEIISEMLQRNVDINFIISKPLFEKIQNGNYPFFAEFIKNNLFHLYVYSKIPEKSSLLSFGYNDNYFLIRLLNRKGEYDNVYVLSSDQRALEWGKELFEYHLKDSVPVTEI